MKKQFRSFEGARELTRGLKLQNVRQWELFRKSEQCPKDLPSSPRQVYKKEWKGWGDWLGTENTATNKREYRSFEEARTFVHSLNLHSTKYWREYCNSGNKPKDIPADPKTVYKKQWSDIGDWLGTGTIQTQKRKYMTFTESRDFVRRLNLKKNSEWLKYTQSSKKPSNIPSMPHKTYKNNGWVSLGDWLGTNSIANSKRNYRKFKDARDFIRLLKLKNYNEWVEYCQSGNKPEDIPSTPWNVYKEWGM